MTKHNFIRLLEERRCMLVTVSAHGLKNEVYPILMCHADIGISEYHDNIKINLSRCHGDIGV